MNAYVTSPDAAGGIQLGQLPDVRPDSNQALVTVNCFSLNRGELTSARRNSAGRPIGWDIAGVVAVAAADGSGPAIGSRVVGFSRASRGWAEQVAIPTNDLAELEPTVSDAQAATLPVAGLTALYALERGERLLGSRVLVTGATGGVGGFAVQLAGLMGAEVVAQVRREDQVEAVKVLGAHQVVVDDHGEALAKAGPFRLIVDGLGNQLTTRALAALAPDGRTILYGASAGMELTVSTVFMLGTGKGRVEGFNLYRESEGESIAAGLKRLLTLVAQGRLQATPDRQAPWTEAPELARQLLVREFGGKAVITR